MNINRNSVQKVSPGRLTAPNRSGQAVSAEGADEQAGVVPGKKKKSSTGNGNANR